MFCDGDFWHGRKWKQRRTRLVSGHNAEYWVKKIEANIARDKRVARQLRDLGWQVIRIWESDVEADPQSCVAKVSHAIKSRLCLRSRRN